MCRIVGRDAADNDWERQVIDDLFAQLKICDPRDSNLFCQPRLSRYMGGPPDIVYISRTAGVHVIEVKGVELTQIEAVEGGGHFLIRYDDGGRRCNPLQQVNNAMFAIQNAAQREYSSRRPCERLQLPFHAWVVFPRIYRETWRTRWGPDGFNYPALLFEDDRSQLANRFLESGRQELARYRLTDWPGDQIEAVMRAFGDNAVLYPPEGLRTSRSVSEGSIGGYLDRLAATDRFLSLEQDELSNDDWDSGPRLLRGVAGSGKTIVLANNLARRLVRLANRQLDLYEGRRPRVLAVCRNRALVPFLLEKVRQAIHQRTGISEFPTAIDVEVNYFNGLMYELSRRKLWRYEGFDEEGNASEVATIYLERLGNVPADLRIDCSFDAIYIDEVQDYLIEELQLLVALWRNSNELSEGFNPLVYLFYDDAQNLHGRRRPNWSNDLELTLTGGRTHVLTECYRNTRQIIEFAFNILYGCFAPGRSGRPSLEFGDVRGLEERGLLIWRGNAWEVRFADRQGPSPTLRTFDSQNAETRWIIKRVKSLVVDECVRPQDVLILTYRNDRVAEIACELENARIAGVVGVQATNDDKDSRLCRPGYLTVSTVHSSKGYDSNFVIFASVDAFPLTQEGRASFYVGCTRAIEYLELCTCSMNNLVREIQIATQSLP